MGVTLNAVSTTYTVNCKSSLLIFPGIPTLHTYRCPSIAICQHGLGSAEVDHMHTPTLKNLLDSGTCAGVELAPPCIGIRIHLFRKFLKHILQRLDVMTRGSANFCTTWDVDQQDMAVSVHLYLWYMWTEIWAIMASQGQYVKMKLKYNGPHLCHFQVFDKLAEQSEYTTYKFCDKRIRIMQKDQYRSY